MSSDKLNSSSIRSFLLDPWSMTVRLACIYSISAFALLTFAAIFLFLIFIKRLEQVNVHFLQTKILVLDKILQQSHSKISPSLKQEVVVENPIDHFYSRIVDATGKILVETPGMNQIAPAANFKELLPRGNKIIIGNQLNVNDKQHKRFYLLMLTPEINAENNPGKHFIQVAKDITSERLIIKDYRSDLFLVLILGIISSATIGIIVTRKGLRPLREITKTTQNISITQLQERLNAASWPKELSELVSAYNNMLDRIEKGFNCLSKFSDDLAHEMRTPISNLMGEAELGLTKPRTNTEYKEILQSICEECQHITKIIETLLFLARAENPRETIVRSLIDVKLLFQDICDFFEAAAETKNVTLDCQGSGYVYANSPLLRRAISNLVTNALRHTPAGGRITLKVEEVDDHKTQISIIDTGEGIAVEHLPHLFERFYRVDYARSAETGGVGLGLAIVKSIMDLHQGKITILSEKQAGVIATLIFPNDSL